MGGGLAFGVYNVYSTVSAYITVSSKEKLGWSDQN